MKKILNIALPILLGVAIMWWMYRGFDFSRVADTLLGGMNWWWMAVSLVFGVLAQVFRGLRWMQTLRPMGEQPRVMNCVHAIFLSYASSLVVPRSGELVRCGVLTRYDGVSFTKALGTVVTERVIDSLLILLTVVVVFLCQIGTFMDFFAETGTNFTSWLHTFTVAGWIVTGVCLVVTAVFVGVLVSKMEKMKKMVAGLKAGIVSLRDVENKWLFVAYTLAIWVSYFLHFYLAFFCFEYTAGLSVMTALVAFIIGSIAVVVPTPNGMGPWHFAVKTILVLYGVSAMDAETFVMIVWAVQTALIPALGVYSMICLPKYKQL